MSDTLRERLRNRGTQIDDAVENAQRGDPNATPPRREAPPPRPEERRGVGRDLIDETTRVILRGIDDRIKALQESGANPQMLAELRNRRKLILEEAERARQ